MPRNPTKRSDDIPEAAPTSQPKDEAQVQIVEREISLSLINDKINYLTGIIHKIAEACEVDLSN